MNEHIKNKISQGNVHKGCPIFWGEGVMQNRTRGVGSSPKIGHPIILGFLALWFTKNFKFSPKVANIKLHTLSVYCPQKDQLHYDVKT